MITLSQLIDQHFSHSPYLREAANRGLLNYTALARELQPQFERQTMKANSIEAISIALRRYAHKIKPATSATFRPEKAFTQLTLQSDLSALTYANQDSLTSDLTLFLNQLGQAPPPYFAITRGPTQTTLILANQLKALAQSTLQNQLQLAHEPQLIAFSLKLQSGHEAMPGVLVYPLNLLSWNDISVVEVISTNDELSIVAHQQDSEDIFQLLNRQLFPGQDWHELP